MTVQKQFQISYVVNTSKNTLLLNIATADYGWSQGRMQLTVMQNVILGI